MRTLILLMACVAQAMAAERLSVTSQRIATEPADAYALVRLTPQREDRWMDVSADCTAHFQRSGFELVGDRTWRIRQVWFTALPSGCCDFIVEVRQTDAHGRIVARAVAPFPLRVFGPGVEGDPCGS